MANDLLQVKCDICDEIAHEPYIECCECDTVLCCSCFASGKEKDNHRNDHKYAIRKNDFPLFENCNWSAKEECKLLNALSNYGYGNWEEIAKSVHTRSKLECQEHYKKYYIENVKYDELKLLPETKESLYQPPLTPYLYNTDLSINPPRNNQSDPLLAGYNAHRSDFELSYDHNAENIFSTDISYSADDEEDDECMDSLKVSLVSALNTRLRERQRRYNIIQEHGLIMTNKLLSWLKRFDSTLSRSKAEKLLSFMQFMSGMQFDSLMESLSLEEEILNRIVRLCDYRRNGIRTLYSARLYNHLKKQNDKVYKEQKYVTNMMIKKFDSQSQMKSKNSLFGNSIGSKKIKRTLMPLDILDMPGYHLLSDSERDLCSNVRVIPENFLDIKRVLIAENNKLGFLRLLDARRVVKIDVNKTRKIYDHLLSEGFIVKP
ncbi:transcriptional adapter 2A [Danaus plexippus]|uniref:transcriptional adapter 2A n=1 Tax=Danaus plexippus TaxID=13037 RepID=UPI002AAF9EA8|nr:transcriptional adapter 2A [Danaus plexippus]